MPAIQSQNPTNGRPGLCVIGRGGPSSMWSRYALVVTPAVVVLAGCPSTRRDSGAGGSASGGDEGIGGSGGTGAQDWGGTWTASPYPVDAGNQPPAPLSNAVLRQVAHVSLGGSRIRVQFSNVSG